MSLVQRQLGGKLNQGCSGGWQYHQICDKITSLKLSPNSSFNGNSMILKKLNKCETKPGMNGKKYDIIQVNMVQLSCTTIKEKKFTDF